MTKTTKILLLALLSCIVLFSNIQSVEAWGVAYGESEVTLTPNQLYRARTSLQNMIGDEEIVVFVSLKGDTDIAKVSETEVTLPAKTRSHPIYIDFTIPEEGYRDNYDVKAVFTERERAGIMVNIAIEKVVQFKISVQDEPEEEQTTTDNSGSSSSTSSGSGSQPTTEQPQETQPQHEQPEENVDVQEQEIFQAVPDNVDTESQDNTIETVENNLMMWIIVIVLLGIVSMAGLWWFGWI